MLDLYAFEKEVLTSNEKAYQLLLDIIRRGKMDCRQAGVRHHIESVFLLLDMGFIGYSGPDVFVTSKGKRIVAELKMSTMIDGLPLAD